MQRFPMLRSATHVRSRNRLARSRGVKVVPPQNPVPPQNLVDPIIVDVSTLGVKLAYPDH